MQKRPDALLRGPPGKPVGLYGSILAHSELSSSIPVDISNTRPAEFHGPVVLPLRACVIHAVLGKTVLRGISGKSSSCTPGATRTYDATCTGLRSSSLAHLLAQSSQQNCRVENLERRYTITPRLFLHGSHAHFVSKAVMIRSFSPAASCAGTGTWRVLSSRFTRAPHASTRAHPRDGGDLFSGTDHRETLPLYRPQLTRACCVAGSKELILASS